MIAAAWTCLVAPHTTPVALAVAGGRDSRRLAGYLSTATAFVSFAAAIVAFVVMLGEAPAARRA